jgi:hypothetical protein
VTNNLAYYSMELITAIKSFIIQAPGVSLLNLFQRKCIHSFRKLDHFRVLTNGDASFDK